MKTAMLNLRKEVKRLIGYFNINTFQRIFIDPCFNSCNLRCPYCPVGQNLKLRNTPQGMMSFAIFRNIWKRSFRHYVGQIGLYNWGEPFLNPDLPEMVRYVKNRSRASLLLNSNFSWKYDDRLLDILDSLENDAIVISCDGFSQEVCEQYRVGVNFDLVMHNIELISRHRKPQTKVKWQYLGFPWNHAEEKAAADYCQSRHIDFHLGRGGVTPNYPMLPSRRVPKEEQSRCDVFRGSLTINFDGEIYPCCMYYGPATYSLGNASKTSVQKIFSRGKGKAMLDYLTVQSPGNDAIFCKHCVERDTGLVESWK